MSSPLHWGQSPSHRKVGWFSSAVREGKSWLRSGSHSCSDSTRSPQVSSAHDSPEQRSLQLNQGSTKLQDKLGVSAIPPLLSGLAALADRQQCWNTALQCPSQLRQHKPAGEEGKGKQAPHCRLQLSSWAAPLDSAISRTHTWACAAGWLCWPQVNPPISGQCWGNTLPLMWKFPTFPVGKR